MYEIPSTGGVGSFILGLRAFSAENMGLDAASSWSSRQAGGCRYCGLKCRQIPGRLGGPPSPHPILTTSPSSLLLISRSPSRRHAALMQASLGAWVRGSGPLRRPLSVISQSTDDPMLAFSPYPKAPLALPADGASSLSCPVVDHSVHCSLYTSEFIGNSKV